MPKISIHFKNKTYFSDLCASDKLFTHVWGRGTSSASRQGAEDIVLIVQSRPNGQPEHVFHIRRDLENARRASHAFTDNARRKKRIDHF